MRIAIPLLLCFLTAATLTRPVAERKVTKVTPLLTMESIEASLPFWMDTLGFEVTMKTPEEGALDFVGLQSGDIEIMLQTVKSVRADLPKLAETLETSATVLYVEVDGLDAIAKKISKNSVLILKLRRVPFSIRTLFLHL